MDAAARAAGGYEVTLELTDIELEVLRECLWMAEDEGLWTLDTLEVDNPHAAFDSLSEKVEKATAELRE